MKFILKCMSCCGGSPTTNVAEEASRKEETAAFAVPTPLREIERQKSRCFGTAKSVFPGQKKKPRFHWRPTLWAISENKVVTDRELVSLGGVASEKIILKTKLERSNTSHKKSSAATNKVYARSYTDTSGRDSSPSMVPSFSPQTIIF